MIVTRASWRGLQSSYELLVRARYANVSNVLLAEETGNIRLSLWNGRIDEVSVGDIVSIGRPRSLGFPASSS